MEEPHKTPPYLHPSLLKQRERHKKKKKNIGKETQSKYYRRKECLLLPRLSVFSEKVVLGACLYHVFLCVPLFILCSRVALLWLRDNKDECMRKSRGQWLRP